MLLHGSYQYKLGLTLQPSALSHPAAAATPPPAEPVYGENGELLEAAAAAPPSTQAQAALLSDITCTVPLAEKDKDSAKHENLLLSMAAAGLPRLRKQLMKVKKRLDGMFPLVFPEEFASVVKAFNSVTAFLEGENDFEQDAKNIIEFQKHLRNSVTEILSIRSFRISRRTRNDLLARLGYYTEEFLLTQSQSLENHIALGKSIHDGKLAEGHDYLPDLMYAKVFTELCPLEVYPNGKFFQLVGLRSPMMKSVIAKNQKCASGDVRCVELQ